MRAAKRPKKSLLLIYVTWSIGVVKGNKEVLNGKGLKGVSAGSLSRSRKKGGREKLQILGRVSYV